MGNIIKSGKKYHRVASSHVSYSAEDLEKLRKEFNDLRSKQGKLTKEEQGDYDRMKQILAHYGVKL